MLPLSSERWSELSQAHGDGAAVAERLARLINEPDNVVRNWNDLDAFGSLCHQGTVYEATFAAIPYVVEVAGRHDPTARARTEMLLFVGYAAARASQSGTEIPPDVADDYRSAIGKAARLAAESFMVPLSDDAASALLAAIAGATGHANLCIDITNMYDSVDCPKCGTSVARRR